MHVENLHSNYLNHDTVFVAMLRESSIVFQLLEQKPYHVKKSVPHLIVVGNKLVLFQHTIRTISALRNHFS